jgi:hypothetical protein
MPTLILSPRYTPDSNTLWKAAVDAGWKVERLHTHRPPAWLRDSDPVFYGEALFVTIAAETLNLALFEPPLSGLADLPRGYVHRQIRKMTLREARAITQPTFIKPAGDKSFDAKVYDSGVLLPEVGVLPETLDVLTSDPVEWDVEVRCFVKQRQLLTLSTYKGVLADSETQAASFCETLLNDPIVNLSPFLVIDVGFIRGRGWAVVEANPSWASGIYNCNPLRVLDALVGSCVKRELLSEQDLQWIVDRTE